MIRVIDGPELEVRVLETDGIVLGAFQRAGELERPELPLSRRASGGGAVRVGPGTIHVVLALPSPDALADADTKKILNRYVRPLLKAITKASIIASYFGRDWVSAAHRPIGAVSFGHDSESQRTTFEAFVATKTPFAVTERISFLGKSPATLDHVAGKAIDPAKLADAIVAAYAGAWRLDIERAPIEDTPIASALDEAPWLGRVEESIGPILADKTNVGGEFMASSDAIARIHDRLERTPDDFDAIGKLIDAELSSPRVALEGVKALRSFQLALAKARGIAIP
jgi:hypothetical protein